MSRHTGSAMLNMARYNDVFLDSQYENGSQGTAFEYELIYYPTSQVGGIEGLKRPNPDSVVGVPLRDRGDDKELYRHHWIIKNNRKEDDYSQLMVALQAIGQSQNSPGYHDQMQQLLDVDEWLRSFAVQTLCGIGDNYVSGAQHNAIFYVRPTDDRLLFLPWDMDFSFTQGSSSGLLNNTDLRKLSQIQAMNTPTMVMSTTSSRRRSIGNTWTPGSIILTSWFPASPSSGISSRTSAPGPLSRCAMSSVQWTSCLSRSRRQGPLDVGDSPTASLEGTGWVDVRQIRLAGQNFPLPITWLTNNQWQVQVPVGAGTHEVTLEAYDFQGQPVATDTITITSTATTPVRDYLRVSEIHYNPADPQTRRIGAGQR